MKKSRFGTGFILLSALLFSIGGVCNKVLPWSALAINCGRAILGLIPVGLYMLKTKHKLVFNLQVAIGTICFLGATALLMLATKFTTSANAIVLQYTAPVFIILYHLIFCRQRPKRRDLITCIVVFCGIICFFAEGMASGSLFGNLMGLLSGVSYAGVCMLNSFEKSDAMSSVFFGMILCVLTGLPSLCMETDFSLPTLSIMAVMGIFQFGLGYAFFAKGLEYASPVAVSLIAGIEPILNPVFVAIFYGERLGILSVVGAVVVIAAVLWYNVVSARETTGKLDRNAVS